MQHLNEILFIDIETVPTAPDFASLSDTMQAEWTRKAKFVKSTTDEIPDPAALFDERAGIFAEFAKIVCIGIGSLYHHDNKWEMRLKSIVNDNEKLLLKEYVSILEKFAAHHPSFRFCGHNIKEFDIPFMCRRMVINEIQLPLAMDVSGKKPWEVSHIDTMDLWKFGDHKNFTSLSLLAAVLGIPSPKSDIDGSMVGTVYWKDKDLARIGRYCMQDVFTTAKVFLKLRGLSDIDILPLYITD